MWSDFLIESCKQSVLVALVIIAAIVMGGGLQAWSLAHGPAPSPAPVQVSYQRDTPVTFSAPREALTYVSANAGFRVPGPAYLPPGYAMFSTGPPY